jgi:2-methylcitrate dehydratase PrpD
MTKGREGMSVITTKDGRRFEKRIDNPHGFGDDPLTDGELEDKFRDMAGKYMGDEQIQKIFDIVWDADRLNDVNELTRLMVFPSR